MKSAPSLYSCVSILILQPSHPSLSVPSSSLGNRRNPRRWLRRRVHGRNIKVVNSTTNRAIKHRQFQGRFLRSSESSHRYIHPHVHRGLI
jgi:hypothetical protein